MYYFSKKYLLVFFVLITALFHFLLLGYYINHFQPFENPTVTDSTISSYINLLQTVLTDNSPKDIKIDLPKLMDARLDLDNQRVNISFSLEPKNTINFSGTNSGESLKKYLAGINTDEFAFSYQLNNKYWLNFSTTTPYVFYLSICLLFLLDVVLGSIFAIYLWTTWRFAMPLEEFKQSAEKIGIDLNNTPLNIKTGPSVVQETASAINRMRDRINHLIDTRTKVLASLSHDLRTPITRLKLHTQFLSDLPRANKIIKDLDEMEQMISSILDFASIDGLHEKKVKLDITALLYSICEDSQDIGHNVLFNGTNQRILINGRFMALNRAFTNLINNAIKYGKKAEIKLLQKPNHVLVYIEDEGPGIPEDEQSRVFNAYYRSKNTMDNVTGNGLGLTIAYEIIHSHEGTIKLENIQPIGLRIIVALPLRI